MNASEQLIKAAKSGNLKDVRKLLSKGALFTKDEFGNTALHEASWTGNNDIVKTLLKAYCFVDSVNGAGFTPLHLASQNGHAKVAKTLLKWKANPSLKNQHEEAAIHLVAKYDHAHLVPVFAAAKVDLDIKGKDDNTALHIAAKLGYISTVKSLIQNGANPNFTNTKNKLPIDYAEIGDYHDTVKILIPLTERPATIGRRATMTSLPRTTTDQESVKKYSFFGRSPKSVKNSKPSRKKYDSPQSLHEVDLRMRQRSNTCVSPAKAPGSRRYSREFEDLPARLSSSSSVGSRSPLVLSQRSSTRSPSLEDLLEDIEKETHGPDYKYIPPQSDDSEDNSSVTYKPLERISVNSFPYVPLSAKPSTLPLNTSLPNLMTAARSPSASPSGLRVSSGNPVYDYLAPRGSKTHLAKPKSPASSPTPVTNSEPENSESYVCLRPPADSDKRTSPDGQDESHTVLSDDVLHHHYEYLPPLKAAEQQADDDYESYVYMAPRNDSHLPPQNVTFSSSSPLNSKKGGLSVKVTSAVQLPHLNNGQTPETNKRAMRSILSQQSLSEDGADKRNSQLEKYLEDELETIRQAFQIRLTQIEKRYQRKLATISTSSAATPSSASQSRTNSFIENQQNYTRRASWHGDFSGPANEQGCPLDKEDESDEEESLSFSVADGNDRHGDASSTSRQNLEEVQDMNGVCRSELANFTTSEEKEDSLPEEAKQILHEKIQEYKSKMMDYFMERAEQQMTSMEQEYEKKLKEATQKAAENNSHLKSSETFV